MRIGIIAIVACFIAGLVFYFVFAREKEADDVCQLPPPKALPPPPGDEVSEGWVVAVKDIPERSLIQDDQFVLKQVRPLKPGFYLIVAARHEVCGLRVVNGIQKGQILTRHDLELPNKNMNSHPKAKKGEIIRNQTLSGQY